MATQYIVFLVAATLAVIVAAVIDGYIAARRQFRKERELGAARAAERGGEGVNVQITGKGHGT